MEPISILKLLKLFSWNQIADKRDLVRKLTRWSTEKGCGRRKN